MSREIKFRGRMLDSGKWVYGVPIKNSFGQKVWICVATIDQLAFPLERVHEFCFEVDPNTVSQFIGRKDKNGVDVYSGDIGQIGGQKTLRFEVVYDNKNASYMRRWLYEEVVSVRSNGPVEHFASGFEFLEVIGNIYENPELLEESAE